MSGVSQPVGAAEADPVDHGASAAEQDSLPAAPRVARRTAIGAAVVVAVLVVAAFAPSSVISDFQFFQLNRVLTVALAIAALNLLLGWSGTISAGHGALFGVGAYTTAILVADHGWPWPLALVASLAVGLIAGAFLGLPALRLGGLNLGLITLAIALLLPPVLNRLAPITGGAFGKSTPEVTAPGALPFSSAQWLFLVNAVVLAVVCWLFANMLRGRMGRALDAAAVSRTMAAAHAVPVNRITVAVFAISAGAAALAGGLSHLTVRTSTPDTYPFLFSIALITGAVVGGRRSFVGAVIGAVFVVLMPEVISSWVDPATVGQWQQVIYAAALLLVIYFFPSGLVGLTRRFRRSLLRRRPARATQPALEAHP